MMTPILWVILCLVAVAEAKRMAFNDSASNYYLVSSETSTIRVSRMGHLDIQTIELHRKVVDFGLDCREFHCYLTVLTARNVQLYSWRRVQFDLVDEKNLFSAPLAVQIFYIKTDVFVAIAQEQLHLKPMTPEGSIRFIGCTILKLGQNGLMYHQFIRLPFNPRHVSYHHPHRLVFSIEPNWNSSIHESFIWSPLNDLFWPHKMSKDLVSSCFDDLQRLLNNRDKSSRKLIESSRSLWRSSHHRGDNLIQARVYVRGNVIVRGSVLEFPQVGLIGLVNTTNQLTNFVDTYSPVIVEDTIRKASLKLDRIRDKLSRAVPANIRFNSVAKFNSPIRFYGPVRVNKITFRNSGIANSNVRLNGIPFKELQHNLISLRGEQMITSKVTFHGKVIADLLEIHGIINRAYRLKDAIDITSKHVQMIDFVSPMRRSDMVAWQFADVRCPELILTPNATLNSIRLDQFITRDNRTQLIFGRKSFKHLSLAQLNVARPGIHLNGHDISRIALNALKLRDPLGGIQRLYGNSQTFLKPIIANKLILNNFINNHINITSLIQDSVKVLGLGPQLISGTKHFLNVLTIAHLTTRGFINGIPVNNIFNLNPSPPVYNFGDLSVADWLVRGPPITGNFRFTSPVIIDGNLNAGEINGINISYRAVRRTPSSSHNSSYPIPSQRVSGRKIFYRPLRVTQYIGLLTPKQLSTLPYGTRNSYPLVNDMDIRLINSGIKRQIQQPPTIHVNSLIIKGNLQLQVNQSSKTTIGKYQVCPLDLFKTKSILGGFEEQSIDIPLKVESLRVRAAYLDPGAYNGLSLPDDFVLRSNQDHMDRPTSGHRVELVYGFKNFDQILIAPPPIVQISDFEYANHFNMKAESSLKTIPSIIFGSASSINNITYYELQDFISHERLKNSTGETIFQTLNVYGNIYATKINGYSWPNDILLKSVGFSQSSISSPSLHRRIYSPLIFPEGSQLDVLNQLVLRGPVQLNGMLNNVNLTEFSRQSATYGDKDLLSISRPIRNKVFLGGLTVTGEVRSQGLIDGIDINEMKNRVITIGPFRERVYVPSPKVFLSDVNFLAPVTMTYVNNLPIDIYLKRIHIKQGNHIQVFGKKIITGTMKINKNLIVQGPINQHDFVDLQAKAISLANTDDDLEFNKTLTIEGDVFMDNLLIDEKNGTLDGVKLTNLLPINSTPSNEMIVYGPSVVVHNSTQGHIMDVAGMVNDCKITCTLEKTIHRPPPPPTPPMHGPIYYNTFKRSEQLEPLMVLPQSLIPYYPPKPTLYNGRNVTLTRTTPPYVTEYHIPNPEVVQYRQPLIKRSVYPDQRRVVQTLALRRPVSIQYEKTNPMRQFVQSAETSQTVNIQLDYLRKQIVSLNINRQPIFSDLVVGFIEATSNDVGNLRLPQQPYPHSGHIINPRSFHQLDQIDFPFRPTIYHLSVGISTTNLGQNVTTVLSSLGGSEINQLSILPIEYPNSAMFLVAEHQTLFLLISQDFTVYSNRNVGAQCPRYTDLPSTDAVESNYGQSIVNPTLMGGIHVYLFHALQNSSSLRSAYFDLYQTIDLPAIDSFENFNYHGSTYALAVSRAAGRVYLLLLRGYSGFQIVSYIHTPRVEQVKVLFKADRRPILLINQTNGLYRLMEPVII